MITNTDLEELRLASSRLTQLALDVRQDRQRAERVLEVLKMKEESVSMQARRAAMDYASAIQAAARRRAS